MGKDADVKDVFLSRMGEPLAPPFRLKLECCSLDNKKFIGYMLQDSAANAFNIESTKRVLMCALSKTIFPSGGTSIERDWMPVRNANKHYKHRVSDKRKFRISKSEDIEFPWYTIRKKLAWRSCSSVNDGESGCQLTLTVIQLLKTSNQTSSERVGIRVDIVGWRHIISEFAEHAKREAQEEDVPTLSTESALEMTASTDPSMASRRGSTQSSNSVHSSSNSGLSSPLTSEGQMSPAVATKEAAPRDESWDYQMEKLYFFDIDATYLPPPEPMQSQQSEQSQQFEQSQHLPRLQQIREQLPMLQHPALSRGTSSEDHFFNVGKNSNAFPVLSTPPIRQQQQQIRQQQQQQQPPQKQQQQHNMFDSQFFSWPTKNSIGRNAEVSPTPESVMFSRSGELDTSSVFSNGGSSSIMMWPSNASPVPHRRAFGLAPQLQQPSQQQQQKQQKQQQQQQHYPLGIMNTQAKSPNDFDAMHRQKRPLFGLDRNDESAEYADKRMCVVNLSKASSESEPIATDLCDQFLAPGMFGDKPSLSTNSSYGEKEDVSEGKSKESEGVIDARQRASTRGFKTIKEAFRKLATKSPTFAHLQRFCTMAAVGLNETEFGLLLDMVVNSGTDISPDEVQTLRSKYVVYGKNCAVTARYYEDSNMVLPVPIIEFGMHPLDHSIQIRMNRHAEELLGYSPMEFEAGFRQSRLNFWMSLFRQEDMTRAMSRSPALPGRHTFVARVVGRFGEEVPCTMVINKEFLPNGTMRRCTCIMTPIPTSEMQFISA